MAKKPSSSSALSLMNGMKKQATNTNNIITHSNSIAGNSKVEETSVVENNSEQDNKTIEEESVSEMAVEETPAPTPVNKKKTKPLVDVDSNDLLKSLVAKEKKNVKKSFLLSQKNADALRSASDLTGVSENEILHQILKQFFSN